MSGEIDLDEQDVPEYEDENIPDFDWKTEEWVLAGDALRETIEFYVAASDGNRIAAANAALAAIKRRLESGALYARAYRWEYAVWHDLTTSDPELLEYLSPSIFDNRDCYFLVSAFWGALEQAERHSGTPNDPEWHQEHRADQDWIAGDFEFRSWISVQKGPMKATTIEGFARGVCFNRSGLPGTNRLQGVAQAEDLTRQAECATRPNPKPASGRPLPEAALLGWWNSLSQESKQMPVDQVLVPLCRASFPHHTIARDRVRALEPGRKPGPKPIRDKNTA